jgi:hypothetical protein
MMSNEPVNSPGAAKAERSRYSDVQGAARFPVKLPIHIKSQSGDSDTESEKHFLEQVLFHYDVDMPVGSTVDFTISLPKKLWGRSGRTRWNAGAGGTDRRTGEEAAWRGCGD